MTCTIFAATHVDDSTGTLMISKIFVDFGGHLKKIVIWEQMISYSSIWQSLCKLFLLLCHDFIVNIYTSPSTLIT